MDRWRIERRNAYNLYCSWAEKPISIFDYNPLPFDDELKEKDDTSMSDEQIYWAVKAANNNFDTPIINMKRTG